MLVPPAVLVIIGKLENNKNLRNKERQNLSLHANISVKPFDRRSPKPLGRGCFELSQIDTQTHRKTDKASMTESAQWGRFSEKWQQQQKLNIQIFGQLRFL